MPEMRLVVKISDRYKDNLLAYNKEKGYTIGVDDVLDVVEALNKTLPHDFIKYYDGNDKDYTLALVFYKGDNDSLEKVRKTLRKCDFVNFVELDSSVRYRDFIKKIKNGEFVIVSNK